MQRNRRQALVETLAAATAAGLFAEDIAKGTLISPAETRSAVRSRTGPESGTDGWWACSHIHPQMHEVFEAAGPDIPTALTQIRMGTGVECLVLSHQAARWQHRFCIPLVGETIGRWVNSIRQGEPLQVSLATDSRRLAMIFRLCLPMSAAQQLPRIPRELPSDTGLFVEEFLAVSLWGILQGAMDTAPNLPAPEKVCLSLLLPPEVLAFAQATKQRQDQVWFEC